MYTATVLLERVLLVFLVLIHKSGSQITEVSEMNYRIHTDQPYDVSSYWKVHPSNPPFENSYLTDVSSSNENGKLSLEQESSSTQMCIGCRMRQADAITSAGNTERYLTKQNYEYYKQMMMKIKVGCHSVSVVMCFLAILSFSRARIRSSSKSLIIVLNLFELVASMISIGSFTLNNVLGALHQVSTAYLLYAVTFINVSCRRVVYVLNMLMSTQRMIVVVLPFKARTSFSDSVNQLIIVSVVLVVFGAHSYIPLAHSVQQVGTRQFVLSNSELFLDNSEMFKGIRDTLIVIFSFIPLLVALLANLYLVYSLKDHFKKAKDLRATQVSTNDKDCQITYMIMSSTLAFTLLSLPSNTNHLLETFLPNYGNDKQDQYLFSILRDGFYSFLVLGDITNFMSYFLLSSAFRDYLTSTVSTFLVTLAVCEKRIRNRDHVTSKL